MDDGGGAEVLVGGRVALGCVTAVGVWQRTVGSVTAVGVWRSRVLVSPENDFS